MSTPTRSKGRKGSAPAASKPDDATNLAADLNYNEAQAALELTLAQLQAEDLPVESMGELYLRGQAYAARCEQLLQQVEQHILLWDSQEPEGAPRAYSSQTHAPQDDG